LTRNPNRVERGDLPKLALSVRQPWAHAILHFGKDIENRVWAGNNPGRKMRGRVALHASAGMTRDEYDEARAFIDARGWTCPGPSALLRGGIVGDVEIVDAVTRSDSLWFFGPVGLVLTNPRWCPLIPCRGALGFFEWREASPDCVPAPAKWMLPQPPRLTATIERLSPAPMADLFETGDGT
jgi:hypothetical protein